MASKSERKFLTTLSFSLQIGHAMFKSYEKETKCNLIKKRSLELHDLSQTYLSMFAPEAKMTDRNLADITRVVDRMMTDGLENTKSFQTYLSMLIGMLSERENELVMHNGSQAKIDSMRSLQELADKCWVYFSSRTRKDEFDELGLKLLNVFNDEFA